MSFKTREKTISFFGQNQYVDWKILLTTLFICFFIATGFGLFIFLNPVDEVDLFKSDPTIVNDKKIKKEVLLGIISRMEDRQKAMGELRLNKPTISDPSL